MALNVCMLYGGPVMHAQAGAQYTFDTAVVATDDPVVAISDFICQ